MRDNAPRFALRILAGILAPVAFLFPHAASVANARDFVLGAETVVEGEVYVIHSALSLSDRVVNTSNIYVVKGTADSVWIFGTGYGDRSPVPERPSDVRTYRPLKDAARTGVFDAALVDSVITNEFGLDRDFVALTVMVPHFHFDHINKEFVAALLEKLRYPRDRARVLVHANDSLGTVCNTPCCGNLPCGENDPMWGVPFNPTWTPPYLNLIRAIGAPDDACNDVVAQFESSTGTWEIRKAMSVAEGGHTDGTINLDNAALEMRIVGANAGVLCPIAPTWQTLRIHGNNATSTGVGIGTPGGLTGVVDEECFESVGIGPNPFGMTTTISYRLQRPAGIVLTIYDAVGRRVRTLIDQHQLSGSGSAQWDGLDERGRELGSGPYFYRLAADGHAVTGKILLVR
ncbi:MAG: FlgD immunoglobulin-like domain containing protein [bacterium]